MQFAINIERFFSDRLVTDRLAQLAKNGFNLFDFSNWRDKNIPELLKAIKHNNLKVTTFLGQHRGNLLTEDGVAVYLKDLQETIVIARQLNCDKLVVSLVELEVAHSVAQRYGLGEQDQLRQVLIANLKRAVAMAEQNKITLLLEPQHNLVDHPGCHLTSATEAFHLVEAVSSANLKVLFDIYLMQSLGGNLIATIQKNIAKIGYFYLADVPGRHEPGTGEINFRNILKSLETLRFNGVVSFNCLPSKDSIQTLRGLKELIGEYD